MPITHALRASAHRRRVGRARERWGRTALLAVGVAPHARPRRPMLAPFPSRHMQVANGAAQIKSGCGGELGGSGPTAALGQRVARNVAHWPPPRTRRPRPGFLTVGGAAELQVWGYSRGQGRGAIVGPLPTLYGLALTVGEWGRVRESWGRIALMAVGGAPHAQPRRPMLAPFASRHMHVANGAAHIKSGCVG